MEETCQRWRLLDDLRGEPSMELLRLLAFLAGGVGLLRLNLIALNGGGYVFHVDPDISIY